MSQTFEVIVVGLTCASTQQGCSIWSKCDPDEVVGHRSQLVTVSTDAGVGDISAEAGARSDAGALSEAGADAAAPVDCAALCRGAASYCGKSEVTSCAIETFGAATMTVRCELADYNACLPSGAVCGRRAPRASEPTMIVQGGPLDAPGWFAAAAALEAESIAAFRLLASELTGHGAPPGLVQRARSAARDEVRHARTMTRLAHPSQPAPRRVARPRPGRALAEMAIDNAVEGCIRETFGALLATWQARHAASRDVREAMLIIARDETEHAALSWDIHEWALTRLTNTGHARVRDAMRSALAKLSAELLGPLHDEVRRATGLPSCDDGQALLRELMRTLWSEATAAASPPFTAAATTRERST